MAWLTIFFGILAIVVIVLFWILLSSRPSRLMTGPTAQIVGISPPTTATSPTTSTQATSLLGSPALLGSAGVIPICTQDSDCNSDGTSTILCINGQCVPRSCRTNGDCGPHETCFQGFCHPGARGTIPCTTTSDCSGVPGHPYCVSGLCSSQPGTPPTNALLNHDTCTTDADCSTGKCVDTGGGIKYCTVPDFTCFFSYSGTEGTYICPASTPFCVQGQCTTNDIGAPCTSAANCSTGYCVNGQCAVSPGRYGDSCTMNTDCASGLKCAGGYCVPINYQPRRFDQNERVSIASGFQMTEAQPMGTGITPPSYPDSYATIGRPPISITQRPGPTMNRSAMGEFTGSQVPLKQFVPERPLVSGVRAPPVVPSTPPNGPPDDMSMANNPLPRPGVNMRPIVPISGMGPNGGSPISRADLAGPPPSVTGWMGSGMS